MCVEGVLKMKPLRLFLVVFFLLSGCASYQVVRIPMRDAELYPLSQTLNGVSVGIDAVENHQRAIRYFGVDLIRQGILPVVITVSNHGDSRVEVNPADIMLRRGNRVIDPLPLERISDDITSWRMSEDTATNAKHYLQNLGFQDQVLMVGDTYQGVLFFPVASNHESEDNGFSVIDVFSGYVMKMSIVVSDLDGNNRNQFGPFTLMQPFPSD